MSLSVARRCADRISHLANAPEKGLVAALQRLDPEELQAAAAALDKIAVEIPRPKPMVDEGDIDRPLRSIQLDDD